MPCRRLNTQLRIGDDDCQFYINDDGAKGDGKAGRWDAVCFGEIGRGRFRDLETDMEVTAVASHEIAKQSQKKTQQLLFALPGRYTSTSIYWMVLSVAALPHCALRLKR